MSWDQFVIFAIVALLCWGIGAVAAWRGKRQWMVYTATLAGLAVFFAFILGMWISLERPPMRTVGETRLWYSFFLPLAGIITYSRWRYKWILSFSFILSLVFVCINLFKPEIHNKTLMPALQSPWFAPHVIVYMFAYAMLGAAAVMAVYLLWIKKKTPEECEMELCDNLVLRSFYFGRPVSLYIHSFVRFLQQELPGVLCAISLTLYCSFSGEVIFSPIQSRYLQGRPIFL